LEPSEPPRANARFNPDACDGGTSDGGKFIAYIFGRFRNCIAPRERQRAQPNPFQSHSADPYRYRSSMFDFACTIPTSADQIPQKTNALI
jgi:hypothetical protein